MRVKDFKAKVNSSIEVPDVLSRINENREKVEQVKTKKASLNVFFRFAIGFGVVVLACVIIIPIMTQGTMKQTANDAMHEESNGKNYYEADDNIMPSDQQSGDMEDSLEIESIYLSYCDESKENSSMKGTLSLEDVINIDTIIKNNTGKDINELINIAMEDYSDDLLNDVTYIVNADCD